MRSKKDFRPMQQECLELAKAKMKCALFLKMGSGKTAITLTALCDLFEDLAITRTLILAPLRVANSVWTEEAKKWAHLKGLKLVICTGSADERLEALRSKADIHILNVENTSWLVDNFSDKKWRWDSIILDESTKYKNHAAKRFKSLQKVCKYFKNVILLSGTPAPKGEMDLWSQVYLIDNGKRLGRNITAYRNRFFRPSFDGHGYELLEGAKEQIWDLIKDVCFTMDSLSEIDLKGEVHITEKIVIPPELMSQYKELEREFILELENSNITAVSRASLKNKLIQFCNGALYDEDKNYHVVHDLKINALKEIMEDNPTENFLIAYNYKSDLERLQKAFPEAVKLKTSKDEEDWNNGKIKILLAHPASAGHGLNLQFGGNVIVWFGLNWSLELYLQFNARLNRSGQENLVRIIHLVAEGCADEDILEVVGIRDKNQNELMEYLKIRLINKHKNKVDY